MMEDNNQNKIVEENIENPQDTTKVKANETNEMDAVKEDTTTNEVVATTEEVSETKPTDEIPVEEENEIEETAEATPVEEITEEKAEETTISTKVTPPEEVSEETEKSTPAKEVEESIDTDEAATTGEVAEEKTEETTTVSESTSVNEVTEEKVEETITISKSTPVEEITEEKVEDTTTTEEVSENSKDETPEMGEKEVEEKKKKQTEEQEQLEKEQEMLDEKAEEVHENHEDEIIEEEDTTVYEDLSLEELVSLFEDLVKIENISIIRNKVIKVNTTYQEKYKAFKKEHREKYMKEAEDKDSYKFDDGGLQQRFNQSFRIYKQKRKEYNEAQELLKIGNLKRKNEILENLRLLIDSEESLKKIYDEFKNLQDSWRQIGMVPKSEAKNLWMNYNFLVDKFFEKVQIDRDLRNIGFKKNLIAKIELTEKTEELLLENSITKTFKLLQEYHRQWREIGPVPHDKSEEIWERFKSATEKVNSRRREYYEKLEEDQKNNLSLKTELCEKAESIANIEYQSARDWNEKSKEFDALFAQWRKIGPAPKKQNDEIWNRFKSSMNGFYKNKKQYFGALKDEQMDNYNAKLDICKSAEAIMESTDWKNTTYELINLQKEWKKIGPVPKKYSDKVWKKFRAACDHFFNAKDDYFKNIKETEKVNLEQKKTIIESIKNTVFSEDKEAALNEMKELQKQWFEIGQVPFRDKNNINREFRSMVDAKLNEIGLSSVDVELMRIKEKTGNDTKGNKEAKYIITKEMNSLRAKIDKIKSEITTWENNIGFFANSKNADVLKKEFQVKIDAANARIKSMKTRVRQLDKTQRALESE